MADVFISYCREDAPFASGNGIEKVLKRADFSFWRDSQTVSGSSWGETIASELRNARAVLVLWSHNSWASHWVRQEAFYAFMKGNLVPIMIKERPAPLELPFSMLQTPQNDARGFEQTIEAIKRLL